MARAGGSARRYAQAVFALAQERNEWDQWRTELERLAEATSSPEILAFLESTRVPFEEKARLLDQHLDSLSPLAKNLAHLLVRKGHVSLAPQIAHSYGELLDAHRGIVQGELVTAVPLEPNQEGQILTALRQRVGKELRLSLRTDPAVLGGLIARIGGQVLDGSTRTQLHDLREELHRGRM